MFSYTTKNLVNLLLMSDKENMCGLKPGGSRNSVTSGLSLGLVILCFIWALAHYLSI